MTTTTHVTGTLRGKAAPVTGGSRGIGAATVLRLAREGADVAPTYVNGGRRPRRSYGPFRRRGGGPWPCGRTPRTRTRRPARSGVRPRRSGARTCWSTTPAWASWARRRALSLADVDRVLAVNVRGVFPASRAAAARMTAGGRIITVGTGTTQRVPGPGGTLDATSESALIGLTKALARAEPPAVERGYGAGACR